MKIIYSTILAASLAMGIGGCTRGYLDQVPDDRLTPDVIFRQRNTTEQFLANVYTAIPDEADGRFAPSNNTGPWTAASDEAKYNWTFVQANNINNGSWNPTSGLVSGYWNSYYRAIRNATYFMQHVDECLDLPAELRNQYKFEARALRAIYYFYLVRTYGPVILLNEDVIAVDVSVGDLQLPRNTMDECINYIVSELDIATAQLPALPVSNDQFGRINKAIAMAYKVEALMLNASPLFNGNTDYAELKNTDGKQLISQTYDREKWKKAADAAKAFIDRFVVPGNFALYKENDPQTGNFSAYLSCRNVMLTDWGPSSNNKEWIMARPNTNLGSTQYERTPYHAQTAQQDAKGGGALGVTQTMVDAYFMANGRSIDDPQSGYVATGFSNYFAPGDEAPRNTYNQWTNREPRFYVGVTYEGSLWLTRNFGPLVTSLQKSGNSGMDASSADYSPTGYIVRKNVIPGNRGTVGRGLPLIRLAQLYLNYCEALNEYSADNSNEVFTYLNLIRERAGIPQYGGSAPGALPVPSGQAAIRDAIRKERRVELAFESSRYFDTRRWKIAETTDRGAFKGLNINGNGNAFYNQVTFETRVFEKKHYLFPIPQGEMNIDKNLVQNTGW
ncbi:MAG: RagB/SusD family nutrient uptake outer membrane protein [Chitinophagaceae bacterium]